MSLESIKYNNGTLEILDQLLLPVQSKYVSVKGVEDGWKVINKMQVCKFLYFLKYNFMTRKKKTNISTISSSNSWNAV